VVLLVAALVVENVATNKRFQWPEVRAYLFDGTILKTGVLTTVELTAITMVLGAVLGVILAIMRLSPVPVISGAAWIYIWLFRGTPVLVQLLIWYNISALYPNIALGLPFSHLALFSANSNTLITQFVAAVLALSLNEAAYMAEIVRAGILSVGEGQTEAATALGMTRLRTMKIVVLPQAMRVIVPPTGNETISMLKTTALASVIGLQELTYVSQIIYSRNFETIPLLLVASFWYVVLVTLLTIGQFYLERHFARGTVRTLPPTPLHRLRTYLRGVRAQFRGRMNRPGMAGGRGA
jgi:polar amino acid transport system permease protein